MIQEIRNRIPLCEANNCLINLNNVECGIWDDPSVWCKVSDNPKNFTILNPKKLSFWLLSIDKCCLDHTFVGRRCDFAIIQENVHFYLIEIKDKVKKRHQDLIDPIQQLENTIKHFESLELLNSYTKRTAVCCYQSSPPTPLVSCAWSSARLRFNQLYRFKLVVGNSLTLV